MFPGGSIPETRIRKDHWEEVIKRIFKYAEVIRESQVSEYLATMHTFHASSKRTVLYYSLVSKTEKKDAMTIARFLLDHQEEISQLSISQDIQFPYLFQ